MRGGLDASAGTFSKNISNNLLVISTDKIILTYKIGGQFTKDNLSIKFNLGDEVKNWTFGMENKGNLFGTTRTLDGMNGDWIGNDPNKILQLEEGIISRDGWCCIDDSKKPLFDNSDYPWVMERPKKNYQRA